jgi:hypothetical protein
MSFFSTKNATCNNVCPGQVGGEGVQGVTERVCIQVKKVYDACMQQEQVDDVRITLCDIQPCFETPVAPLEFVSCRSKGIKGKIRDLCIQRLPERQRFARVRANVDIPIDVVFTDSAGREFTGNACITVRKDVVLFVPCDSIVPFEIDNLVSAICATGDFISGFMFDITICITVILKVVAEVNLLVPAFGFCSVPPCEEFAENVCDEFFGLPIFPPQMNDCAVNCLDRGTCSDNCPTPTPVPRPGSNNICGCPCSVVPR